MTRPINPVVWSPQELHAFCQKKARTCGHRSTTLGRIAQFPDIYFCDNCLNAWPPAEVEKMPGKKQRVVMVGERNLKGITEIVRQGKRVMEITGGVQSKVLPALNFTDAAERLHSVFKCRCTDMYCNCGRPLHQVGDTDQHICHGCSADEILWVMTMEKVNNEL